MSKVSSSIMTEDDDTIEFQHMRTVEDDDRDMESATDSLQHNYPIETTWAQKWSSLLASWLTEILLYVVALCASAIVLILALWYNGNPLQSWPLNITLGTTLTIAASVITFCLAVPLQTAMSQLKYHHYDDARPLSHLAVYDKASRGLAGLPNIFFQKPFDMTAMTVAILILLTFPLASFVQQTISIVVIPVATNQTAISPAYKRGRNFTDVRPHSNDSVISAKGQEALWDVAGSPFGHQQVFRTCATGNCSFPPYESLAVCSTCVNMTESITIHHPVTDQTISSSPCYGSDSQDSAKKLDCVYKLSNGLQMQYGTYLNISSDTAYNRSISELNGFAVISAIHTNPHGAKKPRSSFGYRDVEATQCTLYFCSHVYSTAIRSAIPDEVMTLNRTITKSSKTGESFIYDETRSVLYSIANETTFAYGQAIRGVYAGTVETASSSNGKRLLNFSNTPLDSVFSHGLDKVFRGIAGSFTAYIRQIEKKDGVQGIAFVLEPYFHVNFLWLVYPGAVVALTGIAIIAVGFQSLSRVIWKDNPLAYYHIGRNSATTNLTDSSRDDRAVDNLEAIAEGVYLRIVPMRPFATVLTDAPPARRRSSWVNLSIRRLIYRRVPREVP